MKTELPHIRRIIDGRAYHTGTATFVQLLTADEGSIFLTFYVDRTGPAARPDNHYIPGRGRKLVTDAEVRSTSPGHREFFNFDEG